LLLVEGELDTLDNGDIKDTFSTLIYAYNPISPELDTDYATDDGKTTSEDTPSTTPTIVYVAPATPSLATPPNPRKPTKRPRLEEQDK